MFRWLCAVAVAAAAVARPGNLSLVFCDTKRALNDGTVTAAQLATLLPALVAAMGCNGLRVPLVPTVLAPSQQTAAFNFTISFARAQRLGIYASPMEGAWPAVGGTAARYAAWVAALASAFLPTHLSVFNEVGSACPASGSCMESVVTAVRRALPAPLPLFVGPDAAHVASSLADVRSRPHALNVFDIVSSHNAGADASNTAATWRALTVAAGARPIWSSENPACFTLAPCLAYGGMDAAISAGASGLVSWNTLNDDVLLNGTRTDKGADIAAHTS